MRGRWTLALAALVGCHMAEPYGAVERRDASIEADGPPADVAGDEPVDQQPAPPDLSQDSWPGFDLGGRSCTDLWVSAPAVMVHDGARDPAITAGAGDVFFVVYVRNDKLLLREVDHDVVPADVPTLPKLVLSYAQVDDISVAGLAYNDDLDQVGVAWSVRTTVGACSRQLRFARVAAAFAAPTSCDLSLSCATHGYLEPSLLYHPPSAEFVLATAMDWDSCNAHMKVKVHPLPTSPAVTCNDLQFDVGGCYTSSIPDLVSSWYPIIARTSQAFLLLRLKGENLDPNPQNPTLLLHQSTDLLNWSPLAAFPPRTALWQRPALAVDATGVWIAYAGGTATQPELVVNHLAEGGETTEARSPGGGEPSLASRDLSDPTVMLHRDASGALVLSRLDLSTPEVVSDSRVLAAPAPEVSIRGARIAASENGFGAVWTELDSASSTSRVLFRWIGCLP